MSRQRRNGPLFFRRYTIVLLSSYPVILLSEADYKITVTHIVYFYFEYITIYIIILSFIKLWMIINQNKRKTTHHQLSRSKWKPVLNAHVEVWMTSLLVNMTVARWGCRLTLFFFLHASSHIYRNCLYCLFMYPLNRLGRFS